MPLPHSKVTHRSPHVSAAHIDSLQATPVCLCPCQCHTATSHTGHHRFQLFTLTSGNTSLLMPCHTMSHTGHPMFQLLTLTRFKQHQSYDALPHSKVTHRSPHVSTAHTDSLQTTPVCLCPYQYHTAMFTTHRLVTHFNCSHSLHLLTLTSFGRFAHTQSTMTHCNS